MAALGLDFLDVFADRDEDRGFDGVAFYDYSPAVSSALLGLRDALADLDAALDAASAYLLDVDSSGEGPSGRGLDSPSGYREERAA